MRPQLLAFSAAFTFLAACGGTDPGTGSQTLYVRAALETDGSTNGTGIAVEIRERDASGPVVTDAIVTLRSQSGVDQLLAATASSTRPDSIVLYRRDGFAWDHGFVLSVRRGADDFLDAALELPGVTVITDPVASTTFQRATQGRLLIRWRDEYGRQAQVPEVRLERADLEQTLPSDALQYEVDASRLVPASDEVVTVSRTNKVTLAGGLGNSEWKATTRHQIQFRVE